MRNPKLWNGVLWAASALLIVAIAAYAFQYLLFQDPSDLLGGVERPVALPPNLGQGPPPKDFGALRDYPNPLRAPVIADKGGPVRKINARLLGTLAGGDPAVAYLWIPGRNLNVNAYTGEPVRDRINEQDLPEMQGWTLKSVTSDSATFVSAAGEETLTVETAGTPTALGVGPTSAGLGAGALAGQAWDKSKYTTKVLQSNDSMEVWEIDRNEAAWVSANYEAALQNISMSTYSGGGLKIDALGEDSAAYERGFRTGDVIKVVNGQQIESVARLGEVFKNMGANQQAVTIQVDRGGRMYTMQYRLARPTKHPN